MLEGLCRIRLDSIAKDEQELITASVTQLELSPSGAHSGMGNASTTSSSNRLGSANHNHHPSNDPQLQELGKQLKATTRAFLKLLTQHAGVNVLA